MEIYTNLLSYHCMNMLPLPFHKCEYTHHLHVINIVLFILPTKIYLLEFNEYLYIFYILNTPIFKWI